jgi:hypothetical protein
MRPLAAIIVLSVLPPLGLPVIQAADKLTLEDRIDLTRGLMAEYGAARVMLPRSKKALEFDSNGTYDKTAWAAIAKESGPAARTGDSVQITKLTLESDRIVLEINGGFKGGRKWYQGVQVYGTMGQQVPVGQGDSNAPGGTSIAILFHKPLESIKAAEVKKMLAPVIDFDKHTVTEVYSESLPPEVQKAIKDKRVTEGMNHEQVIMALGRPVYKSRETKDGIDLEDWVYGHAPGKITFVTFKGDKVIKVKEEYAGLGTQVQDPVKNQD